MTTIYIRKKTIRTLKGTYCLRPLSSHKHKQKPIIAIKSLKEKINKPVKNNDISVLAKRIKKSIFRPRHTLISHGRIYNVCKTCPSYHRKRLKF